MTFLSTYPVRGTTNCPRKCLLSFAVFLSTYPVRGTTMNRSWNPRRTSYFYPRTPCGVRLLRAKVALVTKIFLSTYPVRGTTRATGRTGAAGRYFYPRTPCGVRLLVCAAARAVVFIFLSTYPVRGTTFHCRFQALRRKISIHVPRAGYDPAGGAGWVRCREISIHVPRAGYDAGQRSWPSRRGNFYPRTPCGVRPGNFFDRR